MAHHGLTHRRRRSFWRPWRVFCGCGFDRYPCAAMEMLERQRRFMGAPRPPWASETRMMPVLGSARAADPLMTLGQAHRSRNNRPGRPGR